MARSWNLRNHRSRMSVGTTSLPPSAPQNDCMKLKRFSPTRSATRSARCSSGGGGVLHGDAQLRGADRGLRVVAGLREREGSGGARGTERAEEGEGAVGGRLEVDGDGLAGRQRGGGGREQENNGGAGRGGEGERGEVEEPGGGRDLREGGGVEREGVVREDDAEHGGGRAREL